MIAFGYICRSFLIAVAAALLGVTAVYLVIDYVDRAKSYEGAGWLAAVAELYGLKLVLVVYQLAPAALALGAAISLSALRRTGEVTALRALGRGPLVFAAPIATVAAIVGITLFSLEDPVIVPANYRAEEITALRFHRWGDWGAYHHAKRWFRGQDGRRLYQLGRPEGAGFADVHVYELSPEFKLRRRIDAATLLPMGDGRWRYADVVVHEFPARGEAREERHAERLERPPDDLDLFRVKTGRPSQLRRWELPGQIALREQLGLPSREWVLTLHERRAYQLTCVPAALIGAALSLRPRRRGHLTAAIAEGVGVTVGLHAVSALAHTLTLAGHLPPIVGGWLPLAVASLAAAVALRWAR